MLGKITGNKEIMALRDAGSAWMGVSDGYVRYQQDKRYSGEDLRQLQFAAGEAAMLGRKMLYDAEMIERYGMGRVPIGLA